MSDTVGTLGRKQENMPGTFALVAVLAFRLLVSGAVHASYAYLSAGLLGVLIVAAIAVRPSGLRTGNRAVLAALVIYFGALAVSVPLSVAPWLSLRSFLLYAGDLFVFLAVLAYGGNTRALAGMIVAALAISCSWALRQKLGGFEATMESPLADDFARHTLSLGRVFGLTFSPDMLASMLAAGIPVSAGLGVAYYKSYNTGEGRPIGFVLSALAIVLFVVVLAMTKSVGGTLAAGIGTVAFTLFVMKGRAGKCKTLGIAAVIAVFAVVAAGLVLARGGHVLNLGNPNNPAVMRIDNWKTGARLFEEFPLTGAGAGAYGQSALKHRSITGNEAKHAHNTIVQTAAEAGIPGALGVVLVMAVFLIYAYRIIAKGGDTLKAAFAAGGTALLFHSLIDFNWYVPEVSVLFWVSFAVLVRSERSDGQVPKFSMRITAALAVGITALAMFHQAAAARWEGKAVSSARAGDWRQAAAHARRSLSIDGKKSHVLSLLARSILTAEEGRYLSVIEAREKLERALELNPRYPFHYRDLALITMRDDPEKAIGLLEKAVELYPNSLELNLKLGEALSGTGQNERAKEVLSHAVRCESQNAEALFELGLLYLKEKKMAEAQKTLEKAAFRRPVSEKRALFYARFLEQRGKEKEARKFLEEWARENPGKRISE